MKETDGCQKWKADWDASPVHRVMGWYMRIMKRHRGILDQRLKRTGVYRSQHQILMSLSEHGGASQKELAEHLYVSTATIAVSLKKLEKGGYITRLMDQDDNRMNQVCLTKQGHDMVIHSRQFFCNVEAQMFLGFSGRELEIMEQFLKRMYDNLSQIPAEGDFIEREE